MLGTHVAASLQMQGHTVLRHGRDEADLTKFFSVLDYFKSSKPDVIVHCAALVGGIKANIESGPLYYNYNVLIDSNVFRAAIESQIENLIYIGSSCMYPANREAALRPVDIFTGPLELLRTGKNFRNELRIDNLRTIGILMENICGLEFVWTDGPL
jgi:GDP-L-fucose synthase